MQNTPVVTLLSLLIVVIFSCGQNRRTKAAKDFDSFKAYKQLLQESLKRQDSANFTVASLTKAKKDFEDFRKLKERREELREYLQKQDSTNFIYSSLIADTVSRQLAWVNVKNDLFNREYAIDVHRWCKYVVMSLPYLEIVVVLNQPISDSLAVLKWNCKTGKDTFYYLPPYSEISF